MLAPAGSSARTHSFFKSATKYPAKKVFESWEVVIDRLFNTHLVNTYKRAILRAILMNFLSHEA